MIKVLEVIRQGHVGGGESHLLDLVMGFDTDLISPVVLSFTSGKMIDALRACGVKCYVIPTEKPFDMKVLNALKKLICDENIRLIHAHGSRAASNVLLLAGMLHIPLVYTLPRMLLRRQLPEWQIMPEPLNQALRIFFLSAGHCFSHLALSFYFLSSSSLSRPF